MKSKWKNTKKVAHRVEVLRKRALTQTGGGMLEPSDKRALDNPLFAEVITKMNVSAKGNPPRHDSDASTSTAAPTARLKRALRLSSFVDENVRMSTESLEIEENEPFPSTSSAFHQSATTTSTQLSLTPATQSSSAASTQSEPAQLQPAPINRLRRALRYSSVASIDEDTTMSTESLPRNESLPSSSSANRQSGVNDVSDSQPIPPKRRRVDYSSAIQEVLLKQQDNNELQKQYLQLAVERAEIAKKREMILFQKAELDLKTAEECQQIELDKKRKIAELEIEAKRQELGL